MAQKARKDRARANAAALKNLHLGSAIVNGLFLLAVLLLRRPRSLWLFALLSLPGWCCELVLERSGRPRYDASKGGSLVASGEDLAAEGLTEYMFDVVWVTWACAACVLLFGDKAWFLWLVVPAYGGWKGYGLFGAARGMMGGGAGGAGAGVEGQEGATAQGTGNRKQRRAAAVGS